MMLPKLSSDVELIWSTPLMPGDHLFDRLDDLALDDVGRRARDRESRSTTIGALDVRELVGVELQQRDDAEDDERQHRHDGDDRALDGEI